MSSSTRKRKAANVVDGSNKRLQTAPTDQSLPDNLNDEDDDDYDEDRRESNYFSDDAESHTADTPLTPFSPGRKRFPSEMKTIKCTFEGCLKTFNRPSRLTAHIRTHTNERPFVCSFEGCDKSYFEEKHLQQHIKGSHTHERSHRCEYEGCNKSFLTATRLRRHQDVHSGHERFRCNAYPPCNQAFRKHQTLQRHIRSEHLDLAPFPCTFVDPFTGQQCDAGFDGASGLRKHEDRVHTLPAAFCPECVMDTLNPDGSPMYLGFPSEAKLQAHIKKEHANCPFCDLKCRSRRELESHLESQHSGKSLEERKSVPCTYPGCTKKFTKTSNLNVHVRSVHSGQRYICGTFEVSHLEEFASWNPDEACGKDFVAKANLLDHIRTAHLNLPSVINAHRRKPINDDDYESEELIEEAKSGERQRSETLGNGSYSLETCASGEGNSLETVMPGYIDGMREFGMQQAHIEHHDFNGAHAGATAENSELAETCNQVQGGMIDESTTRATRRDHAVTCQDDYDWTHQGDGIFWLGGGEDRVEAHPDQWLQDEMEMRRLIDGFESVPSNGSF